MSDTKSRSEVGDVRRLRKEIDRLFSQVAAQGPWATLHGYTAFRPPTDVYETDDALCVRVEIAGVREEDFRIALVDGTLLVAGVRRDPAPKRGFHQIEISWGPFETEVQIMLPIQEDGIEAEYENGFLVVTLPKARRRRIPVQNRTEESG
jgi:HSP20 family protein